MRHLCNSSQSTIEEQQRLYGGKMWSQVFLTQPYMTSEGLHRLLPVEDLVTEISLAEELVNELGMGGEVDVNIK